MTPRRTKDLTHAMRNGKANSAPPQSVLLQQARRLEALYRESDLADDDDLYDEILEVENYIATIPAADLREAAVQMMLVSAFAECLRTNDGEDPVGLLDKMERLTRSALSVVVLNAGIDLAEYGGERYTPGRTDPFRNSYRLN